MKALLLNNEEDCENGGGEEREMVAVSSGQTNYSERLVLLKQLRALVSRGRRGRKRKGGVFYTVCV